ncbi:MAG: FliH/SctL family protein [Clostridiaceae bacterium]
MIPITLSYKIIKNSKNTEESEKLLHTIDISSFIANEERSKEVIVEEAETETDSREFLEMEIRNEVMEATTRERQAIIENAMLETKQIKEEARKAGALEGYDKGYNEGFQNGVEDARKETEAQRENAIFMVEDAHRKIKAYYEESEEKILHLAVKIAEKIVHQSIDTHAENVMLLGLPILQEYGKTENIIMTCHPENVEFVRSRIPEIGKLCPNAHLLILEDKSLERNGLIIENENQITDLQIKKQLERFLELVTR